VRSINLVRLLGGVNRGMRVLRQVACLSALTLLVALMGPTGGWCFDRGQQQSSIRSFGDTLWWAAAMVTTINMMINDEKYAVSPKARVIAILLRVYDMSVGELPAQLSQLRSATRGASGSASAICATPRWESSVPLEGCGVTLANAG
jgi:hypothetical protein